MNITNYTNGVQLWFLKNIIGTSVSQQAQQAWNGLVVQYGIGSVILILAVVVLVVGAAGRQVSRVLIVVGVILLLIAIVIFTAGLLGLG